MSTYSVPDGNGGTVELPRVTDIAGVLDKPGLHWGSAGVVAEYSLDHLDDLAHQLTTSDRETVYKQLRKTFNDKWRENMKIGSEVHSAIERLILDQETDVPPRARPYIDAFGKFVSQFPSVAWEASEMTVFSLTHQYAGTLDAMMRYGDRLGIVDWKTKVGKTMAEASTYGENYLQLSAYARAEFVLLPDGSVIDMPKVDGASVVMLCTDGPVVVKVDPDEHFDAFLAARRIFDWRESL